MWSTLNIAGYVRISVDLNEESQENTSIENQKQIIADYAAKYFPNAELAFYEDRDRSGYTFEERENYQRLRRELLEGRIRILIVKDFSRFSRRNSLGLLELETLRDAGVRIISIGDSIDYPTKDDWMLIQFKFLMNEMPVTDTSKKIRQIIESRQQNGRWVCAVPYGYRLTNTQEMSYEIDPPAAAVVREVFSLYNEGWGYKKIANYLTDRGIPTPRQNEIAQKSTEGKATLRISKGEWSQNTIKGIVTNDFYIGTLRQKKYTRAKINGKDRPIAPEDQIAIENAHPPIVDAREFFYAQEIYQQRSTGHYRGEKKYPTPYTGILFCGDCGERMFSRSRPDLPASYICGTYNRRGLSGCTSHHVRVDFLDLMLKRYVAFVKDNASSMIHELEETIRQQPDHEEDVGKSISAIDRQLESTQKQLKALYRQKILDITGKSQEEAEIVKQTYADLERDLLNRIKSLNAQLMQLSDQRNEMIMTNRKAKTVLDVFQSILDKPMLDKRDISLIVDKIIVYDDRIRIKLKADIDDLLQLRSESGEEENDSNFPCDSIDISQIKIVQSVTHRPDKVYTVNVVHNGAPLEIFTEKDGELIFKKYSPIGELSDFAADLCESIKKASERAAVICDRDSVIAAAGAARRELAGKAVSAELGALMESRAFYRRAATAPPVPVCEGNAALAAEIAAPILCEGDVVGAVLFLSQEGAKCGESEEKLARAAAHFLGRQMEN